MQDTKWNAIAIAAIACALVAWWFTYIFLGWTPINNWALNMFHAKWLSDRRFILQEHVIPFWNNTVGLGANYIGEDPMFNPLSLGNLLFMFTSMTPKAEWLIGTLFGLAAFGFGTYKFLRAEGISYRVAVLGGALIVLFPRWMDDVYYGPGRMVTSYSALPWILLVLRNQTSTPAKARSFIILGILGSIVFLGSGAYTCINFSYLIVPWYIVCLIRATNLQKQRKIKTIAAWSSGALLAIAIAVCLSAYLLFPLLDNMAATSRSVYGDTKGYFLEPLAMIFPWIFWLFTPGIYNFPVFLPYNMLKELNVDFYFGILAVPAFLYISMNKRLRVKYSFYLLWPSLMIPLHTNLANKYFPLFMTIDKAIGATTSEYYIIYGYVFCFTFITVAAIDDLLRFKEDSLPTPDTQSLPYALARRTCTGLICLYSCAIALWISGWLLSHYASPLLDRLFDHWPFAGAANINAFNLQLLSYAYFFDTTFFLAILACFVTRIFSLRWFSSLLVSAQKSRSLLPAVFLFLDFVIIPIFLVSRFTPDNDIRYETSVPQNQHVAEMIPTTSRIGNNAISQKLLFKRGLIREALQESFPVKFRWDPQAVANIVRKVNAPDGGYYEPLYDPGVNYFPVTRGRSLYNSHISMLPQHFYDFDYAMNGKIPGYSRGSWLAIWDPESHAINLAGIDYLFWYKQIDDPRYKLLQHSQFGNIFLYHNTESVAKAYLVDNITVANNREDAIRIIQSPSFRPKHSAVVEKPIPDILFPFQAALPCAEDIGHVDILLYKPNEIIIDVYAKRDSLLVISDLFFPNWIAYVDDIQTDIVRANIAFRALPVSKGYHKIRMSFTSPAFAYGAYTSLFTSFCLICYFLLIAALTYRSRKCI